MRPPFVLSKMSYVPPHLRIGSDKIKLSVPAFSRKFEKKASTASTASKHTEQAKEEAGPLIFDREEMCIFPIYSSGQKLFKVEGYWQANDVDYKAKIEESSKQLAEIKKKFSDNDDNSKSIVEQYLDVYNRRAYESKLPIAKNHINAQPWCGQEDFMFRLQKLQGSRAVERLSADGSSESRLVRNQMVGNVEYRLKIPKEDGTIDYYAWPYGFVSHYVPQFNIKPTREFHHLVGLLTERE